jgi:PleD family two-component response regulator
VTLKRVLVVDDRYQIRRMMRWAVDSASIEIHEAANGEMGVAMALKVRPKWCCWV